MMVDFDDNQMFSFVAPTPTCSSCEKEGDLVPNTVLRSNVKIQSKDKILELWHKTEFLQQSDSLSSKGWILDIMKCIEQLNKKNFSLNELYHFENYLKGKYPDNNNVQAKIRQQLQILRDKGYLRFESRGKYKLV